MNQKCLEIISQSTEQTQESGRLLARELVKTDFSQGTAFVIGLIGDLGGGKTTFIKGLAQGFGIQEKITSPTFVIMKKYLFQKKNRRIVNFYHIDCYRLNSPKDLLELGFKEIVTCAQNIMAIEWADRVKEILPTGLLWIEFDYLGRNQRRIKFSSCVFDVNGNK